MRRRILVLVVASTAFALLLLGVILVTVIWAKNADAAQDRANSTAYFVAGNVRTADDAAQRTLEILAQQTGGWIELRLPDGTTVTAGEPVTGAAWRADENIEGRVATVWIPQAPKVAAVAGQALLVLLLSLAVLLVTTVVAAFYTRRILRPFDDFRDFIASLSTGDRRGLDKRYGVVEIDMVADVLQAGISRFDETIERERRATQDASHQLKSPLTAISMRLEEIAATDDVEVAHEEATAALRQVERLSGVVDEVVGVLRGQRSSMPVDFRVATMVEGQIAEWLPAFRAEGRALHLTGRSEAVVNAEPGAQAQALATLLENALRHGAGVTTVRLRETTGWAVVEVADQGPGVPADLEESIFERHVSGGASSGLGLALARTLLAADGGRLELVSPQPPVFAMFLPTVDRDVEEETVAAQTVAGPPGAVDARDGAATPTDGVVVAEAQADVRTAASSAAASSSGNTQRR